MTTRSFWIVNPYGPIPGEQWRDYRCALLGRELTRSGYHVTWWTSRFSHHFKRFRDAVSTECWCGFEVRTVATSAYRRNVGIGRVLSEFLYTLNLLRQLEEVQRRPDCIVICAPSPVVMPAVTHYAIIRGIPVLIDKYDLWPELFRLAFPRTWQSFADIILAPLYGLRRWSYQKADAIVALCKTYLAIASLEGGVKRYSYEVFYNAPSYPSMAKVNTDTDGVVRCVYAGTIGDNYDVAMIVDAFINEFQDDSEMELHVFGTGPRLADVIEAIERRKARNVHYRGVLPHEQLLVQLGHFHIGICPYKQSSNVCMPDKIYDYIAGGLAIVNSLQGEMSEFVLKHEVGVNYMPESPDDFIRAVRELRADRRRLALFRKNASHVSMEFRAECQYVRYAQYIERFVREANVEAVI